MDHLRISDLSLVCERVNFFLSFIQLPLIRYITWKSSVLKRNSSWKTKCYQAIINNDFICAGVPKDKRFGSGTFIFLELKRTIWCEILSVRYDCYKLFNVLNFCGTFQCRGELCYLSVLTLNLFEFEIFEVTGSIFLSAWGVRSFVFFFHCLCWPLYVSCQSIQHCILRYQFSPWVFHVITWEMVVLLFRYTQPSDISRARLWFFEGRRKIMLYTERAHFYYRYKVI